MADDKEIVPEEAAVPEEVTPAPVAKPEAKQKPVRQKPVKEDAPAFEGQVIQTDDWNITTGDNYGRPLVKIAPVGWVGDSPLTVHGEKLEGLIKALQKIKSYK